MIERFELRVERLNVILKMLLDKIENKKEITERDQPIEWSIMHIFSCSQLAKIVAKKRNLDVEIAGIAGAIHDLAIIETGIFKEHGPKGAELVENFLREYNYKNGEKHGKITDEELEIIIEATIEHSNKNVFSSNEYVELIKDVDSFDRYLHGKETYDFYTKRTNQVLEDLNLPILPENKF